VTGTETPDQTRRYTSDRDTGSGYRCVSLMDACERLRRFPEPSRHESSPKVDLFFRRQGGGSRPFRDLPSTTDGSLRPCSPGAVVVVGVVAVWGGWVGLVGVGPRILARHSALRLLNFSFSSFVDRRARSFREGEIVGTRFTVSSPVSSMFWRSWRGRRRLANRGLFAYAASADFSFTLTSY